MFYIFRKEFALNPSAKLSNFIGFAHGLAKNLYGFRCFPTDFCNFTAVNGNSPRRTVSAELEEAIRHGEKLQRNWGKQFAMANSSSGIARKNSPRRTAIPKNEIDNSPWRIAIPKIV